MRTCKNCNNVFECACYFCGFDMPPTSKEIKDFCKAMGGWKQYERKR